MDIIYYMKHRNDNRRETFQLLTMITQFGLVMLVSIGLTTALGIWLDRKLGTSFLTILLFFVGAVAGGQSVYSMVKKIYRDEDGKDDRVSEKDR